MTQQTHPASNVEAPITARRDPAHGVCPAHDLVRAREQGEYPIVTINHPQYDTPFDTYAVTRYNEYRQVMTDSRAIVGLPRTGQPGSFANQPGALLFYSGDEHRRLRRKLNLAFSTRTIKKFAPQVEGIVDELLNDMEQIGPPADLIASFAKPLVIRVVCEYLGVPFADRPLFERWAEVLPDQSRPPAEARQNMKDFHDYIADLVAKYKAEPGEGVTSRLLESRDDEDDLADEEIVGLIMNVFIGGVDTTAHSIAVGLATLLSHPDQLAAVRAEDDAIKTLVEESLRYLSPAAILHNRVYTEDSQIGDREISAGERVSVSPLAANWDPELVGDDGEFDALREPLPHVAFGFGPHQCVGQHLARLEMSTGMSRLLERFPNLHIVDPDNLDWRSQRGSIYGLATLNVTW